MLLFSNINSSLHNQIISYIFWQGKYLEFNWERGQACFHSMPLVARIYPGCQFPAISLSLSYQLNSSTNQRLNPELSIMH